jgi:ribosome-associated protein
VSRAGDEGPSKTRRKRDAQGMQTLGEALAELPAEALAGLGLPERLLQALEEYRRISSHEARRRQRQFIGKLMRDIDPEPLQAWLDARERPAREQARLFRLTERWRDRLVADDGPALQEFLAAYPGVDAVALEEAVAAARASRSGAPKRLFRMIRSILDEDTASRGSPRDDALLE